jgi:cephalosporin hydroxylase
MSTTARIKRLLRLVRGRPYPDDVAPAFYSHLIGKTRNFRGLTWMGHPVWQNPLDLWNIQEVIFSIRPALYIECGTNQGGSSMFVAQLMDQMALGEIITVDVERMHDLSHPRISYIIGSSTDSHVYESIAARARACRGPVFVMLDSDHSAAHVLRELELYAPLVSVGSYCMVQDGIIDEEPEFAHGRPGPRVAIHQFLQTPQGSRFEIDRDRCERFLITHHPDGWLKRTH